MNEIVQYHNDLNLVVFKDFNEIDFNNFFAVCYKMKNQGLKAVSIDFKELKELANYRSKDSKRFITELDKIYSKILKLSFRDFDPQKNQIKRFNFFSSYIIDLNKKTLTIQINPDFEYIVNDLAGNFTRFELEEFSKISSKYAKNLYRYFKKWKDIGKTYFAWEDFKVFMDIPDSYNSAMIDKRIINPAIEELKDKFFDLMVIKIKGKGRGQGGNIKGIEFSFLPQQWERMPHPKLNNSIPEQLKSLRSLSAFKAYVLKMFEPLPGETFKSFTFGLKIPCIL